jgi:hypothetical protein
VCACIRQAHGRSQVEIERETFQTFTDGLEAMREVRPARIGYQWKNAWTAAVRVRLHTGEYESGEGASGAGRQTGKTVPRKVGLAPVMRDGIEYEFDVFGDMDQEHTLVITKTRCPKL